MITHRIYPPLLLYANLILSYSGQTLDIKATGVLKETVENGAKIHLQVKYGLITLINQETDLCNQVKNVDLRCPLKKGPLELTKSVNLPGQIPPVRPTLYVYL
jgi:hypothetical protein